MPYEVYKVLHLLGVIMTIAGLAGLIAHTLQGGSKGEGWRKPAVITHGVGLLLVLVAGFGLVARLQVGWPVWVLAKVGIWAAFGGLVAMAGKPGGAKGAWWIMLALFLGAVALAVYKPFTA
jgi:peptidoglycan/LPS O-acetylase OafA/YrhL